MSEQIPIILELENLAWHGTRLQVKGDEIMNQYGLAMELSYHHGKKMYMNTIYYYDIHHKCFPYNASIINYTNIFAKSIKECLEDSETIINIYYQGKYMFEFSKDESCWIKKAY